METQQIPQYAVVAHATHLLRFDFQISDLKT
jgi:hypothetical protein